MRGGVDERGAVLRRVGRGGSEKSEEQGEQRWRRAMTAVADREEWRAVGRTWSGLGGWIVAVTGTVQCSAVLCSAVHDAVVGELSDVRDRGECWPGGLAPSASTTPARSSGQSARLQRKVLLTFPLPLRSAQHISAMCGQCSHAALLLFAAAVTRPHVSRRVEARRTADASKTPSPTPTAICALFSATSSALPAHLGSPVLLSNTASISSVRMRIVHDRDMHVV